MLGLARGTVQLAPYDPEWKKLFEMEAELIRATMGKAAEHVEHIGSTAIEGMWAKPIVDLVVVVKDFEEARKWVLPLESLDYEYRPDTGVPDRVFFAKGPRSRRTHHLSLTEADSNFYVEKILFRDFLREHRDAFEEYLTLKKDLANRYTNDRESYTDGKHEFVETILRFAKAGELHR